MGSTACSTQYGAVYAHKTLLWKTNSFIFFRKMRAPTPLNHVFCLYLDYILLLVKAAAFASHWLGKVADSTPHILIINQSHAAWY